MTSSISDLRSTLDSVVGPFILPRAEEVDREAIWPAHSLAALGEAGLLGLHVPARLGGHGLGLAALAVATETIAKACPSSALCFGMHCVGSAVIAAKATPFHEHAYLKPIAQGRHITTLALSETGTGVHFYLPQTELRRADEGYLVNGVKQFVTNGGAADSYVVSTTAGVPDAEAGEFSCVIVDRDQPGMSWHAPWAGFGMRGNSSRGLRLDDVRVGADHLLGNEGDQVWYIFEVVAPYFLTAMAGTYLGIAQAALDIAIQHVQERHYAHSGDALAAAPIVQHKIAELWIAVEKTRELVYNAGRLGDLGSPQASLSILAAKADASETAVAVTNEAMTICGGIAYRENSRLARLLRDARASHVMSPTTELLKQWLGRSVLGLPLL